MHGLFTIAERELKSYFSSPLAYVFMFIFSLLACGAAFLPEFELFGRSFGGLLDKQESSLVVFFETLPFLLAFFAPAIAMKLWADEKKKGTIELLFTYPISTIEIVLGKWIGAWLIISAALLMTFPLMPLVGQIGNLHIPLLFSGYFAAFLLSGAFTAVSCTASSLTDNSVISLIIGVFICSLLIGLNLFPVGNGLIERFFQASGVLEHFQSLVAGKISLEDILYFVSIIVSCIFLNLFFLETK